MIKTQKSISIKQEILSKLRIDQIEGNPICLLGKEFRLKTGKVARKFNPTIEDEIFATTSIKLIKPYNSQKLISMEPIEYSICSVLKSPSYRKLQNKLVEMMTKFKAEKRKLSKEIKSINNKIEEETIKTVELCKKTVILDRNYDRLENEYFERRRQNYELRAELSTRRQSSSYWNANFQRQLFEQNQEIDVDIMTYEEILEMEERVGRHNVGMKADAIDKLKVCQLKNINKSREQNGEMNCCICCDEMVSHQDVIRLDCQHIHHADCIREWLKIKRFCPLCKGEVTIMKD